MKGQGISYDQQQREMDAQKAYYDEQRMDPLQRIQMRQAFLTNNPAANTGGSYSSGPATSSNPFMTGLSAASTTAGLLGTLGKAWGGSRRYREAQSPGRDGVGFAAGRSRLHPTTQTHDMRR